MLCLVIQSCPTLCDPLDCGPPGSFDHGDSPGKNTEVGCHAFLQGIFPTQGSNPSLLHCRQIFYHLSYQGRTSNEYSGLISFKIDWFGLLTLQGTLKSLLQHHSSKASILQQLAFFMVQLSHPYMTTRKNIALTMQIFVGKLMSLLFNIRSRFIIAFLPRSKHLLIS